MTRPETDVPRLDLRDPQPQEVESVRRLQRVLMTHPVAAQAAFSALVAEGRRFAETEEGRVWRERLVQSALLRKVRLVLDLTTLGLLQESRESTLPSSYLDALFMLGAGGETDAVLNKLFWTDEDTPQAGASGTKGSGEASHGRTGD